MKIQWKTLLIQLAIPLAVGGLSGFLIRDSIRTYQTVAKPPLSPPAAVFPIVWTLLYLLMGLSAYFIVTDSSSKKKGHSWPSISSGL